MFYHLREILIINGEAVFQNLFFYITFRAAFAAITAFLISILLGPRLIRYLKNLKIREVTDHSDSQQLNELHQGKKHTPTMGGLLIVGSVLISCFLWTNWNFYASSMMTLIAGLALIGFADDFMKLTSRGKATLPAKRKMMYLLLMIIPICYLMWEYNTSLNPDSTTIFFPFFKQASIDLQAFYVWWAVLVVVGAANAVNLTDGLDGLAAGSGLMVAGTYAVLAYVAGHAGFSQYLHIPGMSGSGEVAVICASLCGACLGFLWYNAHPAEVFMGDTGSLPLGGAIGYAAVIIKQEILLIIAGGIFVAEAASVILQVGYFKKTGKRLFRIAPLHHHFEFGNIPETKIVIRFWIIGIILAVFAIATLKISHPAITTSVIFYSEKSNSNRHSRCLTRARRYFIHLVLRVLSLFATATKGKFTRHSNNTILHLKCTKKVWNWRNHFGILPILGRACIASANYILKRETGIRHWTICKEAWKF